MLTSASPLVKYEGEFPCFWSTPVKVNEVVSVHLFLFFISLQTKVVNHASNSTKFNTRVKKLLRYDEILGIFQMLRCTFLVDKKEARGTHAHTQGALWKKG